MYLLPSATAPNPVVPLCGNMHGYGENISCRMLGLQVLPGSVVATQSPSEN